MHGNGTKSIIGLLQEIIFRHRDFVIALVDVSEVTAIVPRRFVLRSGGNIATGQYYRFTGQLVIHRRYGVQFSVSDYEYSTTRISDSPPDQKPLLEALEAGEVPGIGADTGRRLVTGFGEHLLTMQDSNALTSMTGVGKRRAFSILANINRYKHGSHL